MHADVLVLNAGSSSLKFALFRGDASELERTVSGTIDRIGRPQSELSLTVVGQKELQRRSVHAPDHASCFGIVWEAITSAADHVTPAAVAHRIVQGGPRFFEPQRVTSELLGELRRLSPFDPQHLPAEIALIEAVQAHAQTANLPQFASFDTAFHRDLPRVARILPIPRRYEKAGIHRYGFHGLSYEFLLQELVRLGDPAARSGRVVLAHLGSGASLAAVRDGKCIDTSMGFTPTSGLVMGTRTGDLDPGLVAYLQLADGMSAQEFGEMINRESGLRGISETSADMRDLLEHAAADQRAEEAVAVFCYQLSKWIGGYAAALGGLDTIVFAGGIGENCPPIRARVCARLEFLGAELDSAANDRNAPVISRERSRVALRVLHTDEEQVIARSARQLLDPPTGAAHHEP
jgi:acetate kinase